MKVKSVITTVLFALIMSACVEDQTYDDIQTDIRVDIKEPSNVEAVEDDQEEPFAP